ncbi:MAG: hypothetical protein ACYTCN_01025 [Planctomycetota bacterium]
MAKTKEDTMNIERINTTLVKAISRLHETEMEAIHESAATMNESKADSKVIQKYWDKHNLNGEQGKYRAKAILSAMGNPRGDWPRFGDNFDNQQGKTQKNAYVTLQDMRYAIAYFNSYGTRGQKQNAKLDYKHFLGLAKEYGWKQHPEWEE